ncbi:MAG: asparagine synthase (glutamine-hydrolyzing) [Pirellulales bacterium]
MCGIAGIQSLDGHPIPELGQRLRTMNALLEHRGPDGQGTWEHPRQRTGLAHRRLSIIDLSTGQQPMRDAGGNWLAFNGEIYNYIELREELGPELFRTTSDTEVILHAYRRWGQDCLQHFRGMFAFALWDESEQTLFCARDHFGIKPFYYLERDGRLHFASECKALLPFVERIEADREAVSDYLAFQFYLDGKTLFKSIRELQPGHSLTVRNGRVDIRRYWEVYYELDWNHTEKYFEEAVREKMADSLKLHLRADVPIGAYVSGGLDSGIVASLAARHSPAGFRGYTGKFTDRPGYDESHYARALADELNFPLDEIDIQPSDFTDTLRKVIYHLDYPIAGPGSFPQYMVSKLAAQKHKVVLGGQGGDEVFGGYARYLIAYFEQCIKGAIDGTMNSGNFVVTYESIIPNLKTLKAYKPMLKQFWSSGLFDNIDRRYYQLINRAPQLDDKIRWEMLEGYSPFDSFNRLFNSKNVGKESYFDQMTHFDFKTLLPALLQVEDRVSMAHGLESRVPLLDHPLIELAATIPANIKFKEGTLKHLLRNVFRDAVPSAIVDRKDKMGFPVPLEHWMRNEARDFVQDILGSSAAQGRELVDNRRVAKGISAEAQFGRTTWGLLCLEVWHQEFADREARFKRLLHMPHVEKQVRVAA